MLIIIVSWLLFLYLEKYLIHVVFSLLVQHVYQLCPQEHVMSMCSCNLMSEDNDVGAGEGRQVFVIGTALVKPEDKEPSFGRILVFQVDGGIVVTVYYSCYLKALWVIQYIYIKTKTS